MTDEDAIHFHHLCELRGELVKMKEDRDSLQHRVELLKKDCDQYLKELATAYNIISNLDEDISDAKSEAHGLAVYNRELEKELEQIKKNYEVAPST